MTIKAELKPCILTLKKIKDANPEAYMAHHYDRAHDEWIGPFVIGLKSTIDAWNLEITLAELEHAITLHNSATTSDEMNAANQLLPPILQRPHLSPQVYIRDYSASDMSILD